MLLFAYEVIVLSQKKNAYDRVLFCLRKNLARVREISIRRIRTKKLPKITDFLKRGCDLMLKGKQLKAIDLLVEGEKSYAEIAEGLKITPKTLYNWRQNDEFHNEFTRKMRLRISGAAPKALRKMETLLDSKNEMVSHLSAKDLLDRSGYAPEDTVNINGAAAVQIIDDIGDKYE